VRPLYARARDALPYLATDIDELAHVVAAERCDAIICQEYEDARFDYAVAAGDRLGIPVIASRYSGNLDFMTDENSWLIDGDLIPVLPGDYAFYQGQKWLEPNVAAAARALRECAASRTGRQRRAALGKQEISTRYNLDVCGETYRRLIYQS